MLVSAAEKHDIKYKHSPFRKYVLFSNIIVTNRIITRQPSPCLLFENEKETENRPLVSCLEVKRRRKTVSLLYYFKMIQVKIPSKSRCIG